MNSSNGLFDIIRCFIRHYHFLLRSIESRNKTIRTQTVLLPMQNIKEANMFWFGRACVSGTLWCLEIQKTFISKAGWAVALPWRNIWIDGIRPSRTLKAVWFPYRLIEFVCFIFLRHSYFSIFFEEHHFPFWQEEGRKFQRLAKLCPHSIPTKPRLLWNNKWKLRFNYRTAIVLSTGINVHAELLAFICLKVWHIFFLVQSDSIATLNENFLMCMLVGINTKQ